MEQFFVTKCPTSSMQCSAEIEEVSSPAAYVCGPFASVTNGVALRVASGVVRAAL